MNRNVLMTILIDVIVIAAAGYFWTTSQQSSTVQIQQKGSDTLLVLAQN